MRQTRSKSARNACLTSTALLSAMAALLTTGAVLAQEAGQYSGKPPQLNPESNINGVDMVTGAFSYTSPFSLRAPAAGHLGYQSTANGWRWSPSPAYYPEIQEATPAYGIKGWEWFVTITTGDGQFVFDCEYDGSGFPCQIVDNNRGVSLEISSYVYDAGNQRADPKEYRFTYRDGTEYTFASVLIQLNTEMKDGNGYRKTVLFPSGEKITYPNGWPAPYIATTNLGYSINFGAVQLLKGSTVLSSLSLAKTAGVSFTETDALGRTFQSTWAADACNSSGTRFHVTSVTSPSGLVTSLTYGTTITRYKAYPVTSLVRGGVTWNYTPNFSAGTMTLAHPEGGSTIVTSGLASITNSQCDDAYATNGSASSVSDPLARTSNYTWLTPKLMAAARTPEGNGEDYTYDDRGNLTAVTRRRKPGSSDVTDSVVTYQAGYDATPAGYDMSCPQATRKTCNQPNWTRDAKGNQTDYTYYSHGATKTTTLPADQNALRLRTYYTYETYTGTTPSIYRLIKTETCALNIGQLSLTACPTGAGTETTTSITNTAYGTSGTAPNTYNTFLPYSVSQTDGNNSLTATTTFTYDAWGRVTAVDGPLPGTGDTSFTTYDAVGRKVCEIGVDPDDGGALIRAMVRHTYNNDDQETLTQAGTGTSTTDCTPGSTMTVSTFKRMTYDTLGRLTKAEAGQP